MLALGRWRRGTGQEDEVESEMETPKANKN